jgi:hypothetical protein
LSDVSESRTLADWLADWSSGVPEFPLKKKKNHDIHQASKASVAEVLWCFQAKRPAQNNTE